jgi:Ca-activated chloride channel family protein
VIRWGEPQLLLLLLAVPLVAAAMLAGAWLRRRSLRRLADPGLVPRLTDSLSPRLAGLKAACLLGGLAFLVLAAARPQWGEKLQVYKGRGIDIVIVLDASKSMLATDVSPNRLGRAKTEISALLDNLTTNRVGIVAFAGEAQVMCPLTPDVEAAKLFLGIIDPDNMPKPGTNIQKAIEAAASLYDPGSEMSRALVLVTDGESLDGDLGAATRLAADEGIRIYAVGVGTPEGSTIPESRGGATSYKKDANDRIVVTRLAERALLVMARVTGGRYFRSETINLNQLVAALDQLQKRSIGGGEYVEYEERFQDFLGVAFALIFTGLLLSDRRGGWFPAVGTALARWRAFRSRPARPGPTGTALLLVALIGLPAAARADVGSSMRKGLALERRGKYAEAMRAFQDALILEPDNVRIHYDIGRVLYEVKNDSEAVDHFQLGVLSKSRIARARSLYNMGDAKFRQRKLDEAITSFSQALLLNPRDMKAKQNLEYCLKMKSEQPQKPDSTQKQPQSQPKPQPQQSRPQPAEARKGAISKEQADRMLQALESKERENLKNQPKKPPEASPGGKDW